MLWSLCFRFFFFSSRRRHTRCSRDWSSDVCSSDLRRRSGTARNRSLGRCCSSRRRSEERRVGKSVDLGGRRIIKKKKKKEKRTKHSIVHLILQRKQNTELLKD